MIERSQYSMLVEWSDEDGVYVVSLPEWGGHVHTHGATYEEAVEMGRDLIEGLVAARRERGQPLPDPHLSAAM